MAAKVSALSLVLYIRLLSSRAKHHAGCSVKLLSLSIECASLKFQVAIKTACCDIGVAVHKSGLDKSQTQ